MAQFSCRTPFEPIVTLKTKEKPKENSIKQQTKPPSQISPTTTPPKPKPNLQRHLPLDFLRRETKILTNHLNKLPWSSWS